MSKSESPFFLVAIGSNRDPERYAKISPQDAELILRYKWKVTHTRKASDRLYYAQAEKYVGPKRTVIKMHRLIMDAKPGQHVAHINGDGLDNRRENLRFSDPQKNIANSKKRKIMSSRFKGVCWHRAAQKWMAAITKDRKQIYLGLFEDEIAAAQAYDVKAKEIFGEYASLNLE